MYWITKLEGGPKRVNHAAVAVKHKIYCFGGYCTEENARQYWYKSMDVHVLNTTTFRWTKHPVSDLPYIENDDIIPYKRYGHTAVVYDDNVYIWGGRNDRASCSVLFCFDTVWHCWTAPPTTGEIPLARDGHTACIWKKYMIIFGGYEEDSNAFADSVYLFDFEKMHWKCVETKGPEPSVRDFHTAVCINDRMYMFGGRGTTYDMVYYNSIEVYPNEIWYLDLKTFEWHMCDATGDVPVGRRSHSAVVYNNKIYIFGGYNSVLEEHFNDLYEFDPLTNIWKRLNSLGEKPCKRRRQACILVNDRIFLFGGTSPQPYIATSRTLPMESNDDKLVDHSDMFVLDLNPPTLKTLAMITVRRYCLDDSILPRNIKMDMMNMFTPNKITITRPNNSAG